MAQKELDLLENVEMRIALADTDEKLSKNLENFLAAVLMKLSSSHEEVRKKVITICTHINKRAKSSPNVKIPVESVVDLFARSDINILIQNFALIYIEMGFQRLSDEDASLMLPKLIWDISKRNANQQIILFNIILPVISKFKEKKSVSIAKGNADPLGFLEHVEDAEFLLQKFIDVVLYNVPVVRAQGAFSAAQSPSTPTVPEVCNSLSKAAVKFLANDSKAKWSLSAIELKSIKLGLLKFLTSTGLFPESLHTTLRFIVFLSATADSQHEIVSMGEDGMRRYAKPDFEDETLVSYMYSLYQGSHQTVPVNSDAFRLPGNMIMKTKVLAYMIKSSAAANRFPNMLQVAFDSLYGEDNNQRLRSAGMSFVQWIARMADASKLETIAPVLLSGLLKFIKEHNGVGDAEEAVKGFAYESIGLLSKRVPSVISNDIAVLQLFIDNLGTEPRNVRVCVQDALSIMSEAYKSSSSKTEIESILLSAVEKSDSPSKFVAAKYANTIFPFSHASARYICLLAYSDAKLEVREEAKKGLKFPDMTFRSRDGIEAAEYRKLLPSLNAVVELLYSRSRLAPAVSAAGNAGVRYVGGLAAETFTRSLEFLRRLIIITAEPFEGKKVVLEAEEFGGLDDFGGAVITGSLRIEVRAHLRKGWVADQDAVMDYSEMMDIDERKDGESGMETYLNLIEKALSAQEADATLQAMAATCLKELVTLSPSTLCQRYYTRTEWIKGFFPSIKAETRLAMSSLLANVGTCELEKPERIALFTPLLDQLVEVIQDKSAKKTLEAHHGAVVGLGFLIGRLTYRYPSSHLKYVSADKLASASNLLTEQLVYNNSLIVHAACLSLAEAGRYVRLPLDSKDSGKLETTIEKLMSIAKTSKENRVIEAAITTIGHLALGCVTSSLIDNEKELSPIYDKAINFFYSLPSIFSKNVEVFFTIGEAICTASGGWTSTQMEVFLDIADAEKPTVNEHSDLMKKASGKMLDEILTMATSPLTKKAYCVWLLCMVKFCGKHAVIQGNLVKIHQAFSVLLADRDEFTQDVASKGTGLVYDLGDEGLKKELVSSLVSTLAEGKKLAPQSVTGETTLFGENVLGTSPDGGSLTTYQSILSLASDMNQPDMVYRFMNLASHHAIWNSRRGASLGFGSIMESSFFAAQAEAEMKPYMSTLIPRLFRYQFDPNAKVAEAMRSIWKSLVKEPKKSIDEFFEIIVTDLIKGLGDRQWRTREACCAALGEVLQGREIKQIEPFLQDIWTMCFRALDDIKESVRVAALGTCKNLTNMTVRYCDPSYVSVAQGQKIMDIVMPFFLTKGLASMAEDIRKFSLSTILKITKKGGQLLKPHITDLASILIECLSSLEPQVMNYLTFHTEKYNISQDQLDSTRLSATKMSPIMECVESTIDQLDASILEALVPKLANIIRKGMGLPTKAGVARYVVSICSRMPLDLQPHADSLLQALSGVVGDRSAPVRKSFATAVGYICRIASDAALVRFFNHLKKLYLENDDEELRSTSGIVILECSRHANDRMKRFQAEVIPVVYFGCRDTTDAIKETWKLVWDELCGGASTGTTKTFMAEIIDLGGSLLKESPSWQVKRQVGLTFSDLAKLTESAFINHAAQVIPMIIEALSGRTWDGKESVFESLTNVSIICKKWLVELENKALLDEIIKVCLREMKKNNKPYKRLAIEYSGKVFEEFQESIDVWELVQDNLIEMAEGEEDSPSGGDPMDVDDMKDKPLNLVIQANSFKALSYCWPASLVGVQEKHAKSLLNFMAKHVTGHVWNIRLAVVESIDKIVQKTASKFIDEETTYSLITNVLKAFEDTKYTSIRERATSTITTIMNKSRQTLGPAKQADVKIALTKIIETETQQSIINSLKKLN